MEVARNQLIPVPAIGILHGRDRKWAWRRARAGSFGPLVTISGDYFATLAGAERYAGRPFTVVQLAAAGIIMEEDSHGTQASGSDAP
jgi:hypothetical protein